ncbi:D-tyrosyl-tRNA(Tyr) deacylase [Lysinibacillus sp. HST-98]|uniref:D-aminoacyl-tRNA deacylase n=1 Tax=Lysinibacillus TaxID=400634 RepID=UPI0001DA5492|nr:MULTISPECIES: D-aminoacyl-tRNA deacylase [Lysinibacillus]EFI69428.1 D-tyrosyl-tRNA(Tyr) deacylase [Lysinibacillus fusiformis ZC1]EKU41325.1 D-tyrosyl-tRNA(Tyr) deacylase [Lysinibacillus fusiformis ZB2]MBL3728714.1 D-tyrosyl-tRNA(Tyr) deacylase [Lysinibacillus sp. HST-98]MBU5251401.1 D-tyrosyl-tRNA(Tyr) deacylase [Lysinibacillus capsici]MED4699120.1 D-aminoacyl-tRNA deacylase [Lysinibacillus capsici]
MKVVLQRSKAASVTVDGTVTGAIDHGYVLLVGITHEDTQEDVAYLAKKVANLRLWEDTDGKMNHSILEHGGAILSVSQFTLYGDAKKGNRPSFINAARPEVAEPLWEAFNQALRQHGLHVETGIFGAMMDVALINDGPVTILLESK